jgi:hypothetical protein
VTSERRRATEVLVEGERGRELTRATGRWAWLGRIATGRSYQQEKTPMDEE